MDNSTDGLEGPSHTKWDNPSSYRGELNGAFPDPNERVMKRKRISAIILATNTDIYTRQRRLGPRPVGDTLTSSLQQQIFRRLWGGDS